MTIVVFTYPYTDSQLYSDQESKLETYTDD